MMSEYSGERSLVACGGAASLLAFVLTACGQSSNESYSFSVTCDNDEDTIRATLRGSDSAVRSIDIDCVGKNSESHEPKSISRTDSVDAGTVNATVSVDTGASDSHTVSTYLLPKEVNSEIFIVLSNYREQSLSVEVKQD